MCFLSTPALKPQWGKLLAWLVVITMFTLIGLLAPGCGGISIPPIPLPTPLPTPSPSPTPTPEPPEPTPVPTPVPTPTPTPEPTPMPEPLPTPEPHNFSENFDLKLANGNRRTGTGTFRSVCFPATRSASIGGDGQNEWKETSNTDNCPAANNEGILFLKGQQYAPQFRDVVNEALTATGITFPTGFSETNIYSAMVSYLNERGIVAAMYGEELAVAWKHGLEPPAPPEEPGAVEYPALPVDEVRIKMHGRWTDGVALSCGPNPDFPGRRCWPTCGPEGEADSERAKARVACDHALKPSWFGTGRVNATNPWMFLGNPGTRVHACVGNVCSAPLLVP